MISIRVRLVDSRIRGNDILGGNNINEGSNCPRLS